MKTLIPHLVRVAAICLIAIPPLARAGVARIVTGADTNSGGPHVKAFTGRTHTNVASFFAYTSSFSGGVRVACGDLNGDGAPDIITGSGPGAAHVKAFSGRDLSELHSFLPYSAGFAGGVFVAAGDVNGDGFDDIVTGTGAGAQPHVKVFDGRSGQLMQSFFAYPAAFAGGVSVAAGDINGDGRADIVTGSGPGGGPQVKVFDGANLQEIKSFLAYSESFAGGVFVAAGDINGDGRADIITGAGAGAAGHVKVFDGNTGTEMHSFFAYSPSFTGGVRVASGDLDGDGRHEILTVPGSGISALVRVFDGLSGGETANFLAYPDTFTEGAFISAASLKLPRLEILPGRSPQEVQLQWPSGCVCEVEGNSDPTNPRGWELLDVKPVENGTRIGLLVPAVQKVRNFRLRCEEETVRP